MFQKLFFQTIYFTWNILVETIWTVKTVTQNLIPEGWTLQLADYFYPCIQIKNTITWTCRASTLAISFALQGENRIIERTFFCRIHSFLHSKLNKKYVSPTTQNYPLKLRQKTNLNCRNKTILSQLCLFIVVAVKFNIFVITANWFFLYHCVMAQYYYHIWVDK